MAVLGRVEHREHALPVVRGRLALRIARRRVERCVVAAGLARVFPFGFGRQVAAEPARIRERIALRDERDGQVAGLRRCRCPARAGDATTRPSPTTTRQDRACSSRRASAHGTRPPRPAARPRSRSRSPARTRRTARSSRRSGRSRTRRHACGRRPPARPHSRACCRTRTRRRAGAPSRPSGRRAIRPAAPNSARTVAPGWRRERAAAIRVVEGAARRCDGIRIAGRKRGGEQRAGQRRADRQNRNRIVSLPASVVAARTQRFDTADVAHVGLPLVDERADHRRVLRGHVGRLAAIRREVVQLPVTVERRAAARS